MSYQSKFTGEEIDAAVNEAKALIGKSVVYCSTATVGQILEVAEVDESGKPTKWKAVEKPSGGASSWNDLTDKPVVPGGAGDTVSWDGNTDGMVSAEGIPCTKISDVVLTAEDLADGCVFNLIDQDGNAYVVGGLDPGDAQNLMKDDGFLSMGCETFVVPYAGYNYGGIVFTEAGIWMNNLADIYGPGWTLALTVHNFTGFATEKFDPAYLYQPDWEQKDEAAPDFVKNKPFYSKVTDVLPETTVAIDQGNLSVDMKARLDIVDGGTYTVNWNGTEYVCVAKDVEQFGVVSTLLGNYAYNMGTGDTGEPFMIAVYDEETAAQYGGYATCIYAFDGSASVTLSVKGEVVKKLDPKYLPDIEAAVMDVLLALGLAPVLLDADGSVLTENDGTLLLI